MSWWTTVVLKSWQLFYLLMVSLWCNIASLQLLLTFLAVIDFPFAGIDFHVQLLTYPCCYCLSLAIIAFLLLLLTFPRDHGFFLLLLTSPLLLLTFTSSCWLILAVIAFRLLLLTFPHGHGFFLLVLIFLLLLLTSPWCYSFTEYLVGDGGADVNIADQNKNAALHVSSRQVR